MKHVRGNNSVISNLKKKDDPVMTAYTQNLEKEREEEESNLLFKTLQKMKFKDYLQTSYITENAMSPKEIRNIISSYC